MSEHSVCMDYSYVLCFQSQVRRQEEKSHRFGFFIEKEGLRPTWVQLLVLLLTICKIWGKLFDYSKRVPIKQGEKQCFLPH